MNTFLLFALIFIPFVWSIWQLVRYTDETIGDRSPVYSIQTYSVTALQHFGTFTHIILLTLSLLMLATVALLIPAIVAQPSALLILPLLLAIVGLTAFFCYFDWQYWKLVRGKAVTMNPFEQSIQVDDGISQIVLTPANVIHLEHHTKISTSTKDLLAIYGYCVFCTEENQTVVLSNRYFIENELLERYFKTVLQTHTGHKLPWPPVGTPELCKPTRRSEEHGIID